MFSDVIDYLVQQGFRVREQFPSPVLPFYRMTMYTYATDGQLFMTSWGCSPELLASLFDAQGMLSYEADRLIYQLDNAVMEYEQALYTA